MSVADDFRIELGHAQVFNSLISELKIDDDFKEKIRVTIEGKNYSALNNLLDKLEPCKAVTAIRSLPSLFGDSYEVKHLGEMNYATST